MDGSPERELVARMRESGCRGPALFVDEAEPFEGLGARPDVLVAHERKLGDGEPVTGWDVVAVGGGEGDHDFAGGADFYWVGLSQYIFSTKYCKMNMVARTL